MSTYKTTATLVVALSMLLLAGCQTRLAVSAPTFDAPVIRPWVRALPTAQPGAKSVASRVSPNSAIVAVQGPLAGKALTPRVKPRPWKYIIIHHSDTPYGGAARFDLAHRERGWAMLGYDFVIGNGTDTRNGLIEVGPRGHLNADSGLGDWPEAHLQLERLARAVAPAIHD